MNFEYDFERLNKILLGILEKNLSADAWKWLAQEGESIRNKKDVSKFNIAFVAMPRKTGKALVTLTSEQILEVKNARKDLDISGWTMDRLSRVWLLMQLNADDKEQYTGVIENLFLSAEMSELVALYSALPVLAHPETWRRRCAEGIRSNIGQVLESVICNNPYPSEQLDEAAWNQLVLKAIFTEKPILQITGLEKRHNRNLAESLSDYAHERWAAHRSVNPLLWIFVSPFIDEGNFSDVKRVLSSQDQNEKRAAALALYGSAFAPARQLLDQDPELKVKIEKGALNWATVAQGS